MEQKQEKPGKANSKTEKTVETKKRPPQEDLGVALVRIFGQDMLGTKSIYVGLTKIKGISWAIANALCLQLNLDKRVKVQDLSKETIGTIEKALVNIKLPHYLLNRRKDLDTGVDKHLLTNDLDIQKEFDIKRLKKMKSYRGLRHSLGLPVRGQRTRSHFRKKGGSISVKKKDDKKA